MSIKENKFIERLLKVSKKTEYYIPDKYDLEDEFEKYKRRVETDVTEPTAFFRLGRIYHHKGEINLAIDNYQRALELQPSDARTHYNLGNAYFKEDRYDEALLEFARALELEPQDVYTLNAIANTYLRLGKYEDALNNHRKALRLSSKDPYAFKGMGDVYMHLGNYDEALNYYQKALENSPEFSMVFYNLGILYGKLGRFNESVTSLSKAIDLDKGQAIFYLALGDAFRELKETGRALENYVKAIEIDPKMKDAHSSLISLLCEQGNYEEAIDRGERLTEFYPTEGWPFGILGLVYFLKKDYQNAIFYYGMAIDYEPEKAFLYSGLGDIYYEQYELTKAGNMYESAIKLSPSVWAYKQLARIYQEQGLWNLAERNYKEAINMAPGAYEVYLELGKFYALTGKLDKALSTFDKALSLNPSLFSVCALEKGMVFMRMGNEDKARGIFEKGIEDLESKIAKEPKKPHFYLQLGLFWRELKNYDKLIEALEKALELKASTEVLYHLGYAYQQRSMPDKAVELYEKSIKRNPRFCSAYECLGIIRLTEGKYNEAIECFNKILEINPRHLYVNYHIARVYEAMAHYDRAEEEYIRCLKVSDFNHKAHHGLASLYTRQGDYSKAIKHYEKAISLNPGEPLYYSDLGDLYKKRGMNKEAAQAYQKAMRYCAQETLKHPYENLYSVMMWRHMSAVQATPSQQVSSEVSEQSEELEAVYNTIPLEPLVIELGRELLSFIDPNYGSELVERLSTVRRHIALDLGFVIPRVRFKDNSLIGKGEYILKVQDVEAARGEVKSEKLLATHKPELLDLLKGERCNDPVYGNPSLWIEKTQRYFAHKSGFMVFDPSTLITIHLAEVIRTHVRHLFGLQETYFLIEALKKSNPVLVNEVYPEKFSLARIHTILVNLLEEKISIRNMASIFETLVDYAYLDDTDLLTGQVRIGLKHLICRDLMQHSNELGAFKLSNGLEKAYFKAE